MGYGGEGKGVKEWERERERERGRGCLSERGDRKKESGSETASRKGVGETEHYNDDQGNF